MKKFSMQVVLVIALLALFTNARAQETTPKTPQEKADKWTNWMKENLKLADVQVPKVQEINLRYANQLATLKDTSSTKSKETQMANVQKKEEAMDNELKGVLTVEQFKTYQAHKHEIRGNIKAKKNPAKSGAQ